MCLAYQSGSKGGLDTSIKNIDEFIGGNKSFDDVLDDERLESYLKEKKIKV